MTHENGSDAIAVPSRVRDRIAGGLLVATGLFVAIEALDYSFGTLSRMGPGMTPFGLGVLLIVLGALVFLFAHPVEADEERKIVLRPVILSLAGVLAFALLVDTAGLIAATAALVFISGFADPDHSLRSLTALFLGLLILVWVVFVLLIGIPFRLVVGLG